MEDGESGVQEAFCPRGINDLTFIQASFIFLSFFVFSATFQLPEHSYGIRAMQQRTTATFLPVFKEAAAGWTSGDLRTCGWNQSSSCASLNDELKVWSLVFLTSWMKWLNLRRRTSRLLLVDDQKNPEMFSMCGVWRRAARCHRIDFISRL